jgi:hypothetical protein
MPLRRVAFPENVPATVGCPHRVGCDPPSCQLIANGNEYGVPGIPRGSLPGLFCVPFDLAQDRLLAFLAALFSRLLGSSTERGNEDTAWQGLRASLGRIHYPLFNCNANAIVQCISYESPAGPSSTILT